VIDNPGLLEQYELLIEFLKRYPERFAMLPDEDFVSGFLLFARHMAAYEFILPYVAGKDVLDIGCFTDYGCELLSREVRSIVAIDMDEDAIGFAIEKRSLPNTTFKAVNATEMPFSDSEFDVVVALEVIEHIPPGAVGAFLDEISRVLRDDGLIILVTPNRKFRLMPGQKPFNEEHWQEFRPHQFRHLLNSRFRDVSIEGIRAKQWIEEIEKIRVRRSAFRAYVRNPAGKLIQRAFSGLYSRLKKGVVVKHSEAEGVPSALEELFNPPRSFSMNDFYLTERLDGNAMELMAISKVAR